MFRFNEPSKDVGNGITFMRVVGGDNSIFNSGRSRRGHVLSSRGGDTVFGDVKVSYMHLRGRVQTFELLQGLISKDVILIDPLVL